MPDKHKRITQSQFDLWEANPVTKAYMQCLSWSRDQVSEALGNGGFVSLENNDMTGNKVHFALGHKFGLQVSTDPVKIFNVHEMIEVSKIVLVPKEESND